MQKGGWNGKGADEYPRLILFVQVKTPGLHSPGICTHEMVCPHFTLFRVKQDITPLQVIDPLFIRYRP